MFVIDPLNFSTQRTPRPFSPSRLSCVAKTHPLRLANLCTMTCIRLHHVKLSDNVRVMFEIQTPRHFPCVTSNWSSKNVCTLTGALCPWCAPLLVCLFVLHLEQLGCRVALDHGTLHRLTCSVQSDLATQLDMLGTQQVFACHAADSPRHRTTADHHIVQLKTSWHSCQHINEITVVEEIHNAILIWYTGESVEGPRGLAHKDYSPQRTGWLPQQEPPLFCPLPESPCHSFR